MWWERLAVNAEKLRDLKPYVDATAKVSPSAVLHGAVFVGPNSMICDGAFIEGPVQIGANCLIGNNVKLRGPVSLGNGTRIGFTAELKNAIVGMKVQIGPVCYVADSVVEEEVYLGALVRTSNHRLDRRIIQVAQNGVLHDTGLEKLGAYIGARASLGVGVVILPGRVVAARSIFGPRIVIEKNLPAARYTLKQELECRAIT